MFDPDMSYLSVWMRPADVSRYDNTVIGIPEAAGRLPLTFSSAKTQISACSRGSKGGTMPFV